MTEARQFKALFTQKRKRKKRVLFVLISLTFKTVLQKGTGLAVSRREHRSLGVPVNLPERLARCRPINFPPCTRRWRMQSKRVRHGNEEVLSDGNRKSEVSHTALKFFFLRNSCCFWGRLLGGVYVPCSHRMPGGVCYRRRLRSLLLCACSTCDVNWSSAITSHCLLNSCLYSLSK